MSMFYEPGRYRCEVVAQNVVKAQTGTPQFVLTVKPFEMYTSPTDTIPLDKQYERRYYRSITEKTMDYLAEDLEYLGFKGASLKALDQNTPGFEDMRGVIIDVMCYKRKDKDDEEWKLPRVSSGAKTELKGEALSPADFRMLDALFGKANKAAPKPATKPLTATAALMGVGDDDLPF